MEPNTDQKPYVERGTAYSGVGRSEFPNGVCLGDVLNLGLRPQDGMDEKPVPSDIKTSGKSLDTGLEALRFTY